MRDSCKRSAFNHGPPSGAALLSSTMDTCGAVFRRPSGGSEEQNEPAAREKLAAAVERFQKLLGLGPSN
jgi:hypothetical protein